MRDYSRRDGQDDTGDHTVQAEHLSEDQDEDKRDEDVLIDGDVLHTSFTRKANSIAGNSIAESTGESRINLKEEL